MLWIEKCKFWFDSQVEWCDFYFGLVFCVYLLQSARSWKEIAGLSVALRGYR